MRYVELGDDIRYYNNLDDAKSDGYFPVKCTSVLQFYLLKGKVRTIALENFEQYKYLYYVNYTSAENRYYMRLARPYPLETLFFPDGKDEAVNNLINFIASSTIWILFTKPQVQETTDMLTRLWKGNLSGEGKVPYPVFLRITEEQLNYDDYKNFGRNLTGFKTVCSQYDLRIAELWKKASESITPKP